MDKLSTNSCDFDKSFKKHNNVLSSELFTLPYSLIIKRSIRFQKNHLLIYQVKTAPNIQLRNIILQKISE